MGIRQFILLFIFFSTLSFAEDKYLLVNSPVLEFKDQYAMKQLRVVSVKVVLISKEYQILLSENEQVGGGGTGVVIYTLKMNIVGDGTYKLIFSIADSNGAIKKSVKKHDIPKEQLLVESVKALLALLEGRISLKNRKYVSKFEFSNFNQAFKRYADTGVVPNDSADSNFGEPASPTSLSSELNEYDQQLLDEAKKLARENSADQAGKNNVNGESEITREKLAKKTYLEDSFLYGYKLGIDYSNADISTRDVIRANNNMKYYGVNVGYFLPIDYRMTNGAYFDFSLLKCVTDSEFDLPSYFYFGIGIAYKTSPVLTFAGGLSLDKRSFLNIEQENGGEILGVNKYLWIDFKGSFDFILDSFKFQASLLFSKLLLGSSDYGVKGSGLALGGMSIGAEAVLNIYNNVNLKIVGESVMVDSNTYSNFKLNSSIITFGLSYIIK